MGSDIIKLLLVSGITQLQLDLFLLRIRENWKQSRVLDTPMSFEFFSLYCLAGLFCYDFYREYVLISDQWIYRPYYYTPVKNASWHLSLQNLRVR